MFDHVSPSLLPVSRGSVALLGLGLSGGRCGKLRSCEMVLFLRPLDRLSRVFRPVSGSLWMNFFSTYLERIHDSLSPLKSQHRQLLFSSKISHIFTKLTFLVLGCSRRQCKKFTVKHNTRRKGSRRQTTCSLMQTFYNANSLCCVPGPLPVCSGKSESRKEKGKKYRNSTVMSYLYPTAGGDKEHN